MSPSCWWHCWIILYLLWIHQHLLLWQAVWSYAGTVRTWSHWHICHCHSQHTCQLHFWHSKHRYSHRLPSAECGTRNHCHHRGEPSDPPSQHENLWAPFLPTAHRMVWFPFSILHVGNPWPDRACRLPGWFSQAIQHRPFCTSGYHLFHPSCWNWCHPSHLVLFYPFNPPNGLRPFSSGNFQGIPGEEIQLKNI